MHPTTDRLILDSMERLAPPEPGEIRLERSYSIPCGIDQAWNMFSRTDWLNRALGLPALRYATHRESSGELIVEGEMTFFGSKFRWREHPFQWLKPHVCGVQRDYMSGPLLRFRGGFDLHVEKDGAAEVRFLTAILPRNEMGRLMINTVVGPSSLAKLDKTVEKLCQLMRSGAATIVGEVPGLNVTPVNSAAFHDAFSRLSSEGRFDSGLLQKLEALVQSADDVEILRLRPFVLARRWNVPKWDVVRLFLHATRAGLFDLSWEVLCPSCGEDGKPKRTLGALRDHMHCDSCEIGFGPEFDRSVELKFSVSPAIRPAVPERFCLGGVNFRQSVIGQITVPPNASRILEWPLEPGQYRLRSDAWERAADFMVRSDALQHPSLGQTVVWDGVGTPKVDPEASAGERLWFENEAAIPLTVRIEKLAEADEILTAREVTNWQEFRDLFSSEVLSPGERLVVGRQIILFTDLRGSTQLYQIAGDAGAYSRVRRHFEVLIDVLCKYRGGLVKTIGDAVMAVFSSLPDALAGTLAMHRALAMQESVSHPEDPLKLKAALHAGPCLMVNANGLLDCFGTTINYAARLLGISEADSIVISDAIYRTEEAQAFLNENNLVPQSSRFRLRGFDEEQEVWKIFTRRESKE